MAATFTTDPRCAAWTDLLRRAVFDRCLAGATPPRERFSRVV